MNMQKKSNWGSTFTHSLSLCATPFVAGVVFLPSYSRQTMKEKTMSNGKRHTENENVDKDEAEAMKYKMSLGDIMWVKSSGSWWPAQVVDEKTVSGVAKPRNATGCEVLVRLYGSYKYMYVDPMKVHSKFDKVLKQYNGRHEEIMKKALEQVNVSVRKPHEESEEECSNKRKLEMKQEKSQEIVSRRIKVMQDLGLIAPSGSPFSKN